MAQLPTDPRALFASGGKAPTVRPVAVGQSLPFWLMLLVILLGACLIALAFFLFSPSSSLGGSSLPYAMRSPLRANYASDPREMLFAPVDLRVMAEALQDELDSPDPGRMATLIDALNTLVPTVTLQYTQPPRPTATAREVLDTATQTQTAQGPTATVNANSTPTPTPSPTPSLPGAAPTTRVPPSPTSSQTIPAGVTDVPPTEAPPPTVPPTEVPPTAVPPTAIPPTDPPPPTDDYPPPPTDYPPPGNP